MGGLFSNNPRRVPWVEKDIPINRFPIISPRHVPSDIPFSNTPYSKFDPTQYEDKFTFSKKALPKYT